MPLVSVVTPVHNRPGFLEEAVKSIQSQTFKDWEHIIVDDGSENPETIDILNRVSVLPGVRVFRIKNQGLGAARNYAIQQSQGSEFILTLDDDDLWSAGFIEKAIKVFKTNPDAAVVTSWMMEFGARKRLVKPIGGGVRNFLVNNSSVHAIFRKDLWLKAGKYDETRAFQAYTDWELWLRITALGFVVYVIEEPLFLYRIHKTPSMLQQAEEKHLELFRHMIEKNSHIYSEHLVESLLLVEKKLLDTRKSYSGKGLLRRMIKAVKLLKIL